MKVKLEIQKISSILSIFGLALLLLLSPCKVRNFIQAELGIPQTKVLNKSQYTISQSDCQTFETSEIVQSNSQPTLQLSDFLIANAFHFEFEINLVRHFSIISSSENQLVSGVPLYILYQNLKVYS